MFQDHKVDSIGFESNWKVEKSSGESSTQTSDMNTKDADSQASASREAGAQTDTAAILTGVAAKLEEAAEQRLLAFLRRIEPHVHKELHRAARSSGQLRAVETLNNEEDAEPATCLHTIHGTIQAHNQQQVSCLSWSPTGAVIAVAHSWPNHEAWCSHDTEIQLYNINMQDFNPEKPSRVLASPSCITSLVYHPSAASLLAAGTYSGEVMVWGGNCDTPVRAGPSEGHGEQVSEVVWMNPGQSSHAHQPQVLLSAGFDGRLLAWRLETSSGPLSLQHSFSIGCQHLPERLRSTSCDDLQPVTSMTLVGRGDQPSCLVGTQAGCVLLCDLRDPTKDDPVVLDFNGHMGAVTSLSVHPTKPQLFASCGEDHEIHLYDLRKTSAIRVLHCSRNCLGALWSSGGSLAWWGGGSEVEILKVQDEDLTSSQLATLEPSLEIGNSGYSTALCFNPMLPHLVAVGDADAKVCIWKVPLPN